MSEVADRYVEQLSTTVETMRRRCIAYYDGVFFLAKRVEKAAERLREVAEPAAYDAHDFMSQSFAAQEPLSTIESDTRNNVVEMYLGIAVVLIGFAGGQLSGVFALAPIFAYFFDNYIVAFTLISIPTYVFYNIRKNVALDDNERRTLLFSSVMCFGALMGYLVGPRILSMAPTTLFIPPLLFALMFDNMLLPTPLVSLNRHTFFASFASISVFLSTLIASLVLGYFSLAVSLLNIVHVTALFVHFQIVMQYVKDKSFTVGESQIAYIGAAIVAQLVFSLIFGYNNYQKSTK